MFSMLVHRSHGGGVGFVLPSFLGENRPFEHPGKGVHGFGLGQVDKRVRVGGSLFSTGASL